MGLECLKGEGLVEWRSCGPVERGPSSDRAGLWSAGLAGLRGTAQRRSCGAVDQQLVRPEGCSSGGDHGLLAGL
jgi:hypothetical protein